MFTAARLRDFNPKVGNKMRSYTSSRGNKYEAGNGVVPSAWRIVKNTAEIAELSEEPQFQIMQFVDQDHFDSYIQDEMENDARMGKPAVRASVRKDESVTLLSRESDEARSEKNQKVAIKIAAEQMLRPTPVGELVEEETLQKPDSLPPLPESKSTKPVKSTRSKKTGRRAVKPKK